jgi:exodeoxyribonuclease X
MLIRVIDFETTGMPPDAGVCEVGWCDLVVGDGPTQIGAVQSILTNPGRPIPIEAMAVHHILDCDVAGAPSPDTAFAKLMEGADIFAAHNAAFERAFFAGGDIPWICTYRCGLRVWPDAPSHSNQALRYFLMHAIGDEMAMPPHRAGPDAYVTAHILRSLLSIRPSADLITWTSEPALLVKCGFGKHRGQKWADVPSDYLDWLLRQRDMGEDIHHTARHHLKRRATSQAGVA